ncbi:MAG: S8 family serine peptidase [Acidobacteria bacterium]|nr:S8 family serine peptidase [Acidobacteriota bacterium]
MRILTPSSRVAGAGWLIENRRLNKTQRSYRDVEKQKFNRAALFGAALALLLTAALVASNLVTGASAAAKSVIVQLKGDPVVVAKAAAEASGREFDEAAYRQQIVGAQDEFLNQLSAAGVQFNVVGVDAPNGPAGEIAYIDFRFNYVYNGVTLVVPEAAIPAIEAMSQVESVQPNGEIELHLDNGVKYTRAPSLYGQPAQIKMGDALATGGYHGEGVNVAVIDTGVEWQHPMFGSDPTPPQFGVGPAVAAAGPNRKVIYYMNYTAGAVTDDFGHGSHVAGITAGYLSSAPGPDGLPLTADDVKIHGVAPQARIMGYKVLSTVGSGQSASIIMAIEDAVQPFTLTGAAKPVAHVINMSLGDTSNNPNAATAVAADNATLAGTTVVASAGNSGAATAANPTGEGVIGSPGAGRRVLTVGANIDPGSAPNKLDEIGGGNRRDMKIFPLEGGAPITADITNNYVFCGLAETPDQVPDSVRGRVALIARGGSVNTPPESPVAAGTGLFSNKAAFALAKGAIAVIVYNNVDGELTSATARKSTIPVVGLSKANGLYLKDAIGSTAFGAVSAHQIRINKALLFEPDMADFSSKGAVNGFGMIKPDVTAPGVSVLSATVRVGGAGTNTATMFDPTGFISTSGTSMSSPMTAGVAALVKQKNPSWTPSMIRAAIMNTATNLRRADGTPVADGKQTLNQQGAGLVDAFAAANAAALMGTGRIDTREGAPTARTHGVFVSTSPGNPDFLGSHSFGAVPVAGVIGTAARSQTVTISDVRGGAGGGVYQLSSSAVRNMPDGVSVSFTNAAGETVSEVEVPAGGSAGFNVNVSVNGESVPANPTQIEWYVTAARVGGGQTLRMPFQFRAVRPTFTAVAPTMGAVSGNEVAGNPPTDINGSYDFTQIIEAAMVDGTVSFAGGVFQGDWTLKNASADTSAFAPLRFTITSVSSRSGRVTVRNADNAGNGVSTPAAYDYTAQAGSDQRLAPGETSGARRLEFNNPASEMFEFTATVRGYTPDAANASGAAGAGGTSGDSTSGGTSSGGTTSDDTSLGGAIQQATGVLRVTVNPLTQSVSVSLVR